MRTLGWGWVGSYQKSLKRKPLCSQLHSGFLENVSGFKYQQLWWRVLGWSDQQTLEEQLPTHGRSENQPGNALDSGTAHPYPEEADQVATRFPPVDSWP